MLKTKLKVGSTNSLTDGRYFAAMGAEWIGFCFDPSHPRFVEATAANEIMNWLSGPRFVGEFVNLSVEEINDIVKQTNIDIVQVSEKIDLTALDKQVQSVIQLIEVSKQKIPQLAEQMHKQRNGIAQFVLNFGEDTWENMGEEEQAAIASLCKEFPIFLKLQFAPETIIQIIEFAQPFGVELMAGDELSTGLQSFEEVDALLEVLEE